MKDLQNADRTHHCSYNLLVELQAILKLANRFVDCLDGFHAMPAKIMSGMLQMVLGSTE